MTARHSEPLAPTARSEGPPGIDWTHVGPECATCWCARLVGDLPTSRLVSARTQAAVAAAALALSTTAPAVVLAAGHSRHGGQSSLHEADPRDADVGLPIDDSPSVPAAPDPEPPGADPENPDPGTLEAPEPVAGPSEQDAPTENGSDTQQPAPDDVVAAPSVPDPAPADGTHLAPPSDPRSATTAGSSPTSFPRTLRTERHIVVEAASTRSHRSNSHEISHTALRPTPRSIVPVVAPGAATTVSRSGGARSRDGWHAVRVGESLWSIARNLLGKGASDSRIAAEVDRLWELNRDRIASGDPDLLPVGTRLQLR